jgi:hypothetical protein
MHPNLRFFLFFFCLISSLAWSQQGCSDPLFYYPDMDRDGFRDDSYSDHIKIKVEGEFLKQGPNNFAIHEDGKLAYGCLDIDPNHYAVDFAISTYGTGCDDTDPEIHPGSVWYYDSDGDGEANLNDTKFFDCEPDDGYIKRSTTDCNDNNNQIHSKTIWYFDTDDSNDIYCYEITSINQSYLAIRYLSLGRSGISQFKKVE